MLNRFLSWRASKNVSCGGLWIPERGMSLQNFGNIGWTYVYNKYTIVPVFIDFWCILYSLLCFFWDYWLDPLL